MNHKSLRRQAVTGVCTYIVDNKHIEGVRYEDRLRILMELAVLRDTFTELVEAGCELIYDDGDERFECSMDVELALSNLYTSDEEKYLFRYNGKRYAIMVVTGNDGWDVIADYSAPDEVAHAFLTPLADELADADHMYRNSPDAKRDKLARFLYEWLKWAEAGGKGSEFDPKYGLCGNHWSTQGKYDSPHKMLIELLDQIDGSGYPFGGRGRFGTDSHKKVMHDNPQRLDWVRQTLRKFMF